MFHLVLDLWWLRERAEAGLAAAKRDLLVLQRPREERASREMAKVMLRRLHELSESLALQLQDQTQLKKQQDSWHQRLGRLKQDLELTLAECAESRTAGAAAAAVRKLVDRRDRLGRSAAYLAAEGGRHGILTLLRRHRADLSCPDLRGVTPLHRAAQFGHVAAVRYLIGLDARKMIEAEDAAVCVTAHPVWTTIYDSKIL